MKYYEIILEFNEQRLIQDFGKKLVTSVIVDSSKISNAFGNKNDLKVLLSSNDLNAISKKKLLYAEDLLFAKNAPPDIFYKAFKYPTFYFSMIRAKNCPVELLEKMSKSKSVYVRKLIASAASMPDNILKYLTNDPNKTVAKEAKTTLRRKSLMNKY